MSRKYLHIVLMTLLVVLGVFVVYTVINSMIDKNYPVTINKIDVNESPDRVVSLSPNLTAFIIENGYETKLAGVSNYCTDVEDKLSSVPRLGTAGDPNVNEIVGLKPKYVLTSTPINKVLKAEIEKHGITVLDIETDYNYSGFNNSQKDLFYLFEGKKEGEAKLKQYIADKENAINTLKSSIDVPSDQTFVVLPMKDLFSDSNSVESKFLEPFLGKNLIESTTNIEEDRKKAVEGNPSIIIAKEGTDISDFANTDAYKNQKVYYISFAGFEQNNYDLVYNDIKSLCKNVYGLE